MRLLRSHLHALRRARSEGDGGYVFVTLALVMVILLLFAGFSVDVGSWYARASKIQRASDAASLAGVVWMPDIDKATDVARATAKANGFDWQASNIDVQVDPIPGNDHQLKVTITDNDVKRYFSGMVIPNQTLGRTATAEYAMPVPLGSPDNTFGNQGYSDTKNLWASVSAPYTDKINGDPFMTHCGVGESFTGCSGNDPVNGGEFNNSDFYVYTVDVPSSAVGKVLNLEVFDAGNYARSNYANVETADNGTVNTEFELFNPPVNALDSESYLTDSTAGDCGYSTAGKWNIDNNTSSTTYKGLWVSLCKINVTKAGQFHLRVRSYGTGSGWNQFSFRANVYTSCPSGNNTACSGQQTGAASPDFYGYNALSLFNNLPNQSGNLSATFYLARIDQIHAGKHMIVELFDPGDGQSGTYYVNILKPGDTTVSTINCSYGLSTDAPSSFNTASPCKILTRNSGGNTYNGKWLKIDIAIPSTYTCSTDCWWKVKYDFNSVSSGASPNDRTVWKAQIVGDPVHLVKAG